MKKILFFLLSINLLFSAQANSVKSDLQVNSEIQKTCQISSNDINFGYWNFKYGNIGIQSSIDVLCNKGLPYIIGGSEHGGSWPYQGSDGNWVYVIKMFGSNAGNEDWLAYRIHIGHNVVATDYRTQTNNILGMGNFVNASKNMKSVTINSIGTGSLQQHPITGILYGNDNENIVRFKGVKPDTYSDTFSLTIIY